MDFFTFISNIIRDLAWPALIGFSLYFSWKHRNEFSNIIEKIRYKDFELTTRKFDEARDIAEKVQIETPQKQGSSLEDAKLESSLIILRPDIALLDLWKELENELATVLNTNKNNKWITHTRLIENLYKNGKITEADFTLYQKLREIRNHIVHSKDSKKLTENEVLEYKDFVNLLTHRIREITNPLDGIIDQNTIIVKTENAQPAQKVTVAALLENKTVITAITDESGTANISIPSGKKYKLLLCGEGYESKIYDVRTSIKKLEYLIQEHTNGGSALIQSTGYIPGFSGRLNPILDTSNRTYLYADNIAINGGEQQPVTFQIGIPITLEDVNGIRISLTVKLIEGRVCLIDYKFSY